MRGLLDSVVIANETIDFLRKDRRKGVIVKVDFKKAYDSVEWKFLEYMMMWLGFHCRWIKWIKSCLNSTTVSILINGSLLKNLDRQKGLDRVILLPHFCFLL